MLHTDEDFLPFVADNATKTDMEGPALTEAMVNVIEEQEGMVMQVE